MNEIKKNYKEITKNGILENSKVFIIKKFGFETKHKQKRMNSEKINNSSFLLSKSSINNSKNEINKKINFSIIGKNLKNIDYKNKALCKSYSSLINNISIINKKKKSRNYNNHISSNITNDNTISKYYSSFFNYKPKIYKTQNNNENKNSKSSKLIKNFTQDEKYIKNKNFDNKKDNKYNELFLSVKPIIKKNENIINNKLWSKLIKNIDQKQNIKISKLKNQFSNNVNININANININIENNFINCNKKNDNIYNINNNINYCNLTTNNINININDDIYKKDNSKKYLPNISFNEITNYNPPEKDNSTVSIDENNDDFKKENKNHFNKIIEERKKERDKLKEIKEINENIEKIYIKEKSKKRSIKDRMSIKKENKLHKLYSSSMFEDNSNADNNNNKREIKYCDSDSFKTSNENNEKEKNNNKNISNTSFIGDDNSYYRIIKKSLDDESSEKEKNINNESDFTESNNRNILTNYNNKYYNIYRARNNYSYKTENLKIHRLLSKNYSFNVSSRNIYDKSPKKFDHENPNINYHFITYIEKNNNNIINLSKKKFLKLKDKCIFQILSFSIDSYLPLINSDKLIKNKVNKSLNNIFNDNINDFNFKYKNYLEIINYKFEYNTIKSFYKDNNYILDLVLNCKIISKNIGESIVISCNYLYNKEKYDYLWIFDLQKKEKIKNWVSSEINSMKNYLKTISYTSQVSSFSYGDEIQIHINVFNMNNILEPNSLEWCEPIITKVNPEVFENTKFINKISFDPLRACEIEKQILLWHDKLNREQIIICEEVREIFKNFFEIRNIFFDKSKFYFYKFVMVPYKIGLLKKNKYCSFDINIIDINNPAKNEIQCIYLINANNYTNKMDIRVGNYFTLYIIDMQIN